MYTYKYSGWSNNMRQSQGKIKNQLGRSMIEIISVLSIMGILSIGGINGFGYALDLLKANSASEDISSRVASLMHQVAKRNQFISLDALGLTSKDGYKFGEDYDVTDDGVYYLTLSGMSKRVCSLIFDRQEKIATKIIINGTTDNKNACADNNKMAFYFKQGKK